MYENPGHGPLPTLMRRQWKDQNREIAPISLPLILIISGVLWGALGKHPGLTSRESCTKSPA